MKQIILIIILLSVHLHAYTCSCVPLKSFCDQSAKLIEWSPEHVIIVRGEVIDVVRVEHRRDLIVQIHESFYNPQNLKQIRIKDGNGADCGQSLENFEKGDELIFMTGIHEEEGIMGQFSACYPGPLVVNRNRVRGRITSSEYDEDMSLNSFRNLPCIPSSDHISFYPNPASHQIQVVASEMPDNSGLETILVNSLGQIVLQYSPTSEERQVGHWSIPVQHLPQGTYFLHTGGNINRRQVFKVFLVH